MQYRTARWAAKFAKLSALSLAPYSCIWQRILSASVRTATATTFPVELANGPHASQRAPLMDGIQQLL